MALKKSESYKGISVDGLISDGPFLIDYK